MSNIVLQAAASVDARTYTTPATASTASIAVLKQQAHNMINTAAHGLISRNFPYVELREQKMGTPR